MIAIAPIHDADRWLKARLDLVVASLPMGAVINPIWAALFMIPFGGAFPAFGVVPMPALLAVVCVHFLTSVMALAIHTWSPKANPPPRRLLTVLLAFQTAAASSWALTAMLCWVEGNDANNTLVTLIVIANMWALVLTRGYHAALFGIGLGVLLASSWLLSIVSEGQAASLFVFITPIFAAYAWFMGASSRDRTTELLRSRFALEDTTNALEAARADAVAQTREVEAASASKSAFVANMSHELRTPLNAILGFAEMIEAAAVGPDISQQYRGYGHDIRESGSYLLTLINDMLDVAKIEAGKMELDRQYLDGKNVIDSALRLVAHRAEQKKQTLNASTDTNITPFADERAFKQILVNLLSNAVKFSPEGGTIDVACMRLGDGGVRLTVGDSGPGIPDDKIAKLFRPFERVDNSYGSGAGGTGLGLALVRGLVGLHAGRVWVENKSSGGLLAHVELPGRELRAVA
ncbi:MAG: HAMP domain-containing histidine kinase [Alphaproteobacteria bacterium]|nr:HAMP domain-containing histidine kinase [Alphaproteobacteria bacterium]